MNRYYSNEDIITSQEFGFLFDKSMILHLEEENKNYFLFKGDNIYKIERYEYFYDTDFQEDFNKYYSDFNESLESFLKKMFDKKKDTNN